MRLVEKQKLRALYGVSERQMRTYFAKASRRDGVTGEELLKQLETRLDNVVYRLGFSLSLRQARQLVSHGHVTLNGRKVNVPSIQVKPTDTIEVGAKAKSFIAVREALEIAPEPPDYLYRNKDEVQGALSRQPERGEIPLPVELDERLVVEHYSK